MESIFNTKFIESAIKEIEKLSASGNNVTRSDVLKALGYDDNADNQQAISLAIRIGELKGYKVIQKVGIKPDTFVPKRKAPKVSRKKSQEDSAEEAA